MRDDAKKKRFLRTKIICTSPADIAAVTPIGVLFAFLHYLQLLQAVVAERAGWWWCVWLQSVHLILIS